MRRKLLDYIHRVRISKAKSLLNDLSLSIETVSSAVGYTNIKTFTRAFKKFNGMPPAEFRRQEIYRLS